MLSKEEIEKAKEISNKFINNEMQRDKLERDCRCGGLKIGYIYKHLELNSAIKTLLQYIQELERENRKFKVGIDIGLNKDKKTCFYKDGNTGKCLGYSNVNDDEPCEYCKTCEALSIKGDD